MKIVLVRKAWNKLTICDFGTTFQRSRHESSFAERKALLNSGVLTAKRSGDAHTVERVPLSSSSFEIDTCYGSDWTSVLDLNMSSNEQDNIKHTVCTSSQSFDRFNA